MFELRLWLNVGLVGDERLMVVRVDKNRGNAFYSEFEEWATSRPVPPGRNLPEPKRGWKNLQEEVSNRLTAQGKLKRDPKFLLDRHEGLISLEYAQNGEYQFVFYGHHSSFEDAVRLKDVCEFLSAEFGLNLDCQGQSTTLRPIR
jgi:hypothetical protein